MATAELSLPHPAMQERRFVVEPLAEIAGDGASGGGVYGGGGAGAGHCRPRITWIRTK